MAKKKVLMKTCSNCENDSFIRTHTRVPLAGNIPDQVEITYACTECKERYRASFTLGTVIKEVKEV